MKIISCFLISILWLFVVIAGAVMFATMVVERDMELTEVCPILEQTKGFSDCVEGSK